MKNCKERERPENKLNPQKTSKPNHRQSEQQQPTADKARKAQMGRAGVQQETGPLVQTSCDSPLQNSFFGLVFKISAHISTFLSSLQLSHSLSPSHTGQLWVLPNETMLGPSPS